MFGHRHVLALNQRVPVELEQRFILIGGFVVIVERPAAAAVNKMAALIALSPARTVGGAVGLAVEMTVSGQGRIELIPAFDATVVET